jgi:hypothetical protein
MLSELTKMFDDFSKELKKYLDTKNQKSINLNKELSFNFFRLIQKFYGDSSLYQLVTYSNMAMMAKVMKESNEEQIGFMMPDSLFECENCDDVNDCELHKDGKKSKEKPSYVG